MARLMVMADGLIGADGFGVRIRGSSMVHRGIQDGDIVWVRRDLVPEEGDVVLALATDPQTGVTVMVMRDWPASGVEVVGVGVAITHARGFGLARFLRLPVLSRPPDARGASANLGLGHRESSNDS